jgi:hypothetical protein
MHISDYNQKDIHSRKTELSDEKTIRQPVPRRKVIQRSHQ